MSDKMTRKELKAPDEFQRIGAQAVPLLVQHQKSLVIGVALVVGVCLAVFLFQWLGQRSEERKEEDLGAALRDLSREVRAGDAPAAEAGDPPSFKTESEKDEAIIKTLTEFRGKTSGSRAAATAALPLGQALLREGKGAEAIAAFDDYLKKSASDDPLRPTALEGRGYALESKKDYDGAIAAFDQLAKENNTEFMKGMGLYHRARILLLQGKTQDGVKQLQEIEGSAPGSSAARLATERIGVLASQGVAIPPPPPKMMAITLDAGT